MRRLLFVCLVLALALPTVLAAASSAAPARGLAYYVYADIVRGSKNPTGTVCVQTSVYKQGEEVVWRVMVRDILSGREIGDDGKNPAEITERGMKVTAFVENGQSFPLKYGKHPGRAQPGDPVKYFWTAGWDIPADYPTGMLRWWIIVTDKTGASIRFDPIGTGIKVPAYLITVEKR